MMAFRPVRSAPPLRRAGRGAWEVARTGMSASPRRSRIPGVALALLALTAGCQRPTLEGVTPDQIETTLFLIGDAGEPDPRTTSVALEALAKDAAEAPGQVVIVFLGDNVYPAGIPEEGAAEWADARRRLAAQVDVVPEGALGIFVPGNHDWADMEAFGLYSIRLQEAMIAELAGGRDVRLLPSNGCPGPVSVDVGRLRLVLLDTQWWLHDYIVRDERSDCPTSTTGEVTEALRRQVWSDRRDGVVVVAAHHPLMTGGRHGGYCGISGPFQRFAGRSQDIVSSANRTMRDSIESAMADNPPLIFAAGHEHNQQVLRGGRSVHYQLVTGAGSKTACAVKMRETYYVSQHRRGFMRIEILRDGRVFLRVFRYTSDGEGGRSYSRWLEPR